MYNQAQIYFDQDFSPELQRRRMLVRDAVKQLKVKNIKAKCVFPAQLRVWFEGGEKTYSAMSNTLLALKEMGLQVWVDERELLETDKSWNGWRIVGEKPGRCPATPTHAEIKTSAHRSEVFFSPSVSLFAKIIWFLDSEEDKLGEYSLSLLFNFYFGRNVKESEWKTTYPQLSCNRLLSEPDDSSTTQIFLFFFFFFPSEDQSPVTCLGYMDLRTVTDPVRWMWKPTLFCLFVIFLTVYVIFVLR